MQNIGPFLGIHHRRGWILGVLIGLSSTSMVSAWQFRDVTDLDKDPAPSELVIDSNDDPVDEEDSLLEVTPLTPFVDGESDASSSQDEIESDLPEEPSHDVEALDEPPANDAEIDLALPDEISKLDATATASPTTDEKEANLDPIRPMRFNGLLVGTSTEDDMLSDWGEPFRSNDEPGYRIAKYRIEPFRQVDVELVEGLVASILIHLEEPLDAAHCASQLRISEIGAVPVPADDGGILGLVFPERGVVFSNVQDDPESLVGKILLELPTAESFLLRAEYDFETQFESDLADIEQALSMDSNFARAYHVRSNLLISIGRYHDALDEANQAVRLEPSNKMYLLAKAELLGLSGSYEAAMRLVNDVLEVADLDSNTRAVGELVLGDLIAKGPTPRFKESLAHHLRAIELAAAYANDLNFADRRRAKMVLLQAHLGVARDISRGKFQKQDQVVPKWIRRATALVEEMVRRDQADPALRLRVHQTDLAARSDLRSAEDPSDLIRDAISAGERMIEEANDPLNIARLKWELGVLIAEAVNLQRLRGELQSAWERTDEALVLLKDSAIGRQSTSEQKYTVGRLYFHVGSLSAVREKDHELAISWYKKAQPLLLGELPVSILADPGNHGESFVSMGVSYWNVKQRDKAIDLTEHGADILQQAVVDGVLKPDALTIPYRNLASMHQLSGNEDDAQAFLQLAASLKIKLSSETSTH